MSAAPGQSENIAEPLDSPSPRGKGFLAVCGSLFFHGVGHLIAGRYRRGLFWFVLSCGFVVGMVICAMVSSLMPVLIVLMPLGIIQTIWCLIDSYIVGRRSPRTMLGRPLWRYLAGIAIVVASLFINPALWAALAIRSHLFEAFSMPSDSMSPTLVGGDRFIVNKKKDYGRWSIVGHDSLDHREVKLCKRIVGLPGERIDIVDGDLTINGKSISRPAEIPPYRDPPGVSAKNHNLPLTLGKDEYFVIGDNSTGSGDSRIWSSSAPGHQRGVIPKEYIIGTVTAIYWPARRWRRFE